MVDLIINILLMKKANTADIGRAQQRQEGQGEPVGGESEAREGVVCVCEEKRMEGKSKVCTQK